MSLKKTGLTILILGLTALAYEGTLNEQASVYIDQIFKQALATFAVARTLNGLISVAQGTKLAVEPAGVGVNFALGEVLDPINDLIESFSWVMLASTTSLGIQKLLLEITGWKGVRVFLLISALLFITHLWLPKKFYGYLPFGVSQLLLVALFLNFTMPLIAVLSDQVFEKFIQEKQQTSIDVLVKEGEEFKQIKQSLSADENAIKEKTWRGKFSTLMGGMWDSLNFETEIEKLK